MAFFLALGSICNDVSFCHKECGDKEKEFMQKKTEAASPGSPTPHHLPGQEQESVSFRPIFSELPFDVYPESDNFSPCSVSL